MQDQSSSGKVRDSGKDEQVYTHELAGTRHEGTKQHRRWMKKGENLHASDENIGARKDDEMVDCFQGIRPPKKGRIRSIEAIMAKREARNNQTKLETQTQTYPTLRIRDNKIRSEGHCLILLSFHAHTNTHMYLRPVSSPVQENRQQQPQTAPRYLPQHRQNDHASSASSPAVLRYPDSARKAA